MVAFHTLGYADYEESYASNTVKQLWAKFLTLHRCYCHFVPLTSNLYASDIAIVPSSTVQYEIVIKSTFLVLFQIIVDGKTMCERDTSWYCSSTTCLEIMTENNS